MSSRRLSDASGPDPCVTSRKKGKTGQSIFVTPSIWADGFRADVAAISKFRVSRVQVSGDFCSQ